MIEWIGHNWVAFAAVLVAVISLAFSRRDAQSKKTRDELADLRAQLDRNQDKIYALEDEIRELKRANQELEAKNIGLMKRFIDCPAPDCPLLRATYDGQERRSRPRKDQE